jgi:hypothetical protein
MSAWQLLPAIRDLYRRLLETYHDQPWELQHVLYSLGDSDDLADEAEIAAARLVDCSL